MRQELLEWAMVVPSLSIQIEIHPIAPSIYVVRSIGCGEFLSNNAI